MSFRRASVLLLLCLTIVASIPFARTVAGMADDTPTARPETDALDLRREAARRQAATELEKYFTDEAILLAKLDRGFRAATNENEALELLEKMQAAKAGAERRALEIRIEAAVAHGLEADAGELRAQLQAYDAERARVADANAAGSAVEGGQRQ